MLKFIRKIKWENLVTIASIVFGILRLLEIIDRTGVNADTPIEIAIYAVAVIGARYLVKDLRTNPTNWFIEK
jgi:hypothetical protein